MRRLTLGFFSAFALTAGLTACKAPVQSGSTMQSQQINGFDKTLAQAKSKVDTRLGSSLDIPTPLNPGGGYTHETHKANGFLLYDVGQLYKLTGDKKYAEFAGLAMMEYADVYPSWGLHPAKKEQSPRRMFWQNLNESMFLLNIAQTYGAIKDTFTDEQRDKIETDLLRNMADFLSVGAPETFNKVHNHGTWATAAVGLTGYAIGDDEYVEQALLGLDKSGEAGFLKQMDVLFSPDGYYNEGPYYHRFALKPFIIFGKPFKKIIRNGRYLKNATVFSKRQLTPWFIKPMADCFSRSMTRSKKKAFAPMSCSMQLPLYMTSREIQGFSPLCRSRIRSC